MYKSWTKFPGNPEKLGTPKSSQISLCRNF